MRPHRLGSNFDPRCRLRRVDAADARVSEVESQGPEDVVDAALVYDRKALMAEVEEPHRSRSRFGGAAGCTDGFNLEEARCKACGRCGPLEIGDEGCHLSNCSIQLSCGNETEQIWFEPLLPCDQEEESCHSASLGSAPVEYCLRRQQSECICMFVRVSARPAGSIGPADRLPGTALAAALGGLGHRGGWLAFGLALVESSGDVGGLTCSVGYAFVKAPPIRSVEDGRPLQLRGSTPTVSNASTAKRRSHFSTWQVATGLGLVASAKVARASTEVDWTGSATGWGRIRQKSILDVDWLNIHGVMTLSAVVLFVAQISRILARALGGRWSVLATALPSHLPKTHEMNLVGPALVALGVSLLCAGGLLLQRYLDGSESDESNGSEYSFGFALNLKHVRKVLFRVDCQRAIEALPSVRLEQGEACAICLEPLEEARQLPCGHLFHQHCLLELTKSPSHSPSRRLRQEAHRAISCPLCREDSFAVTGHGRSEAFERRVLRQDRRSTNKAVEECGGSMGRQCTGHAERCVIRAVQTTAAHQKPTELEVWLTAMVYLPWIYFCWRDSEQLENHYAVTFYASCGWAVMSLSSLFSVLYQDKYPDFAFGVLLFGNAIFAVACLYFYSYHWTRMWRHFTQNRFRPLWIPGLLGLMCLHLLTPLDLMKRLDDPGWWKTVCQVYNDEPVGPERRSHRCCVCVTIDHFPKQSLGGTALSVGLFLRMMVNVPFPKR
eukprot:g22960.t2